MSQLQNCKNRLISTRNSDGEEDGPATATAANSAPRFGSSPDEEDRASSTSNKVIIDSGFISGNNIVYNSSGGHDDGDDEDDDTKADDVNDKIRKQTDAYSVEVDDDDDDDHGEVPQHQRLDSGVIDISLSSNLSGLNLEEEEVGNSLNDLNGAGIQPSTAVAVHSAPGDGESAVQLGEHCEPLVADTPAWTPFYEQDENGDTPLHCAIIEGRTNIVLALIRTAPYTFLLDIANDAKETPLHLAAATGQWQYLRWLVVAGAKLSARNVHGDSALHLAVANGDLHCLNALIQPVVLNERYSMGLNSGTSGTPQTIDYEQWNYIGQTVMHVAALSGHTHILRYLVGHGANINSREGLSGQTVLHYAVRRADSVMLDYLLDECPHLVAATLNYGGNGALQLDCKLSEIVAYALIQRGVPPASFQSISDSEESEDEDGNSDDENSQTSYSQNNASQLFAPCLVNASA